MKYLQLKTFGTFLIGREEGSSAYAVIKRDFADAFPNEKIFCNFSGVLVFAPSYCDEVFGKLQSEYPDKFVFDVGMSHALKVSFDTVEQTRGVKFVYGNNEQSTA